MVGGDNTLGSDSPDIKELGEGLGFNLQDLWLRHSSVLQSHPRKLGRPVRCKPGEFQARLYELGRYVHPTPTAPAAEDSDDDEEQQPEDDFASDHNGGSSE